MQTHKIDALLKKKYLYWGLNFVYDINQFNPYRYFYHCMFLVINLLKIPNEKLSLGL